MLFRPILGASVCRLMKLQILERPQNSIHRGRGRCFRSTPEIQVVQMAGGRLSSCKSAGDDVTPCICHELVASAFNSSAVHIQIMPYVSRPTKIFRRNDMPPLHTALARSVIQLQSHPAGVQLVFSLWRSNSLFCVRRRHKTLGSSEDHRTV